jgi:hypothetical protein
VRLALPVLNALKGRTYSENTPDEGAPVRKRIVKPARAALSASRVPLLNAERRISDCGLMKTALSSNPQSEFRNPQ